MRWAEDHKGLIKWRGMEWRWIRRCVKMGKRECSDAYQWGRDGSSRLDKCSSRVALLSTLDGQLPFPTQPPIPIPYSKGFLPSWKSKAYHAHPQSRELWPLVISSITFLIFLPPTLLHSSPLVSFTISQIPQACFHFNNFALALPSAWNALPLNSQTTSSLNYSSLYSNAHMIQESFLIHPFQNSTYILLNCSLASCPSYCFVTIRVINW